MPEMSPDDFFDGFVSEDCEDWKKTPESIRLAFHLAVSASHLVDHFFEYHRRRDAAFAAKYKEKELPKFQAELNRRTPYFEIIRHMANAYKHLYPRSGSISSGGSIESITYDEQEIVQSYGDGNNTAGKVVIKHKDRTVTDFETAIEAVMEKWREIMSLDDPTTV